MSAHEPIETYYLPLQRERDRPSRSLRALEPARNSSYLAEHVGPRMADLARAISERIRHRPFTSLAVAVGLGFAIGGALTFRAGRVAIAAATRHVARELLKQVL